LRGVSPDFVPARILPDAPNRPISIRPRGFLSRPDPYTFQNGVDPNARTISSLTYAGPAGILAGRLPTFLIAGLISQDLIKSERRRIMTTHGTSRSAFILFAFSAGMGICTRAVQAEPPRSEPEPPSLLGVRPLDPFAELTDWLAPKRSADPVPLATTPFDPFAPRRSGPGQPELPTNKSLRLSLGDSLFLYGQVQKDQDWMPLATTNRMIGDTGVAWKLPNLAGAELLFRCGPEMTYDKAFKSPDRSPGSVRPQWLKLDLQARWSLLGPVGLECEGTALPALTDLERDRIIQDIRAVVPVGRSGQFQLGAKHIWENASDSKSWSEGTQFYGGFKLGW
jgi:hypothetical protein